MKIGKQLLSKKCKEVIEAQKHLKHTSMSVFKRFLEQKKKNKGNYTNKQAKDLTAQEIVEDV